MIQGVGGQIDVFSRTQIDELSGVLDAYKKEYGVQIEDSLHSFLPEYPASLREAASYCLFSKGKRLRPLLVLLGAGVAGGSVEDALKIAVAVEFVHTSSLIFDDLPGMDNSDKRRGQKSLHVQFGEGLAILTGLFFLNKAYELALQKASQKKELLHLFTECIGEKGMIAGQVLDLEKSPDGEIKNRFKTGALFRLAIMGGVLTGSLKNFEEKALEDFSILAGDVYQLCDDLLDDEIEPNLREKTRQKIVQTAQPAIENLLDVFPGSKPAKGLAAIMWYSATRSK